MYRYLRVFLLLCKESKTPTMKLLHQIVIPRVASDWEQVAYYLDYEVEFIRLLRRHRTIGDLECCKVLFEDWLSTSNGKSPKTWSTLIRVLREVEQFKSTTEKIIRDLVREGVIVY